MKLRLAAQAEKLVAHIEGLPKPETPLEAERMTTTPKPITALRTLMKEPGVEITRAPTSLNAGNLAKEFLQGLHGLYGGTRLAAQELEGLVVDDDIGAMRWSKAGWGRFGGSVRWRGFGFRLRKRSKKPHHHAPRGARSPSPPEVGRYKKGNLWRRWF